MLFLAAEPDLAPITNLITTWIHIGQALVGVDRRTGVHLRVPREDHRR